MHHVFRTESFLGLQLSKELFVDLGNCFLFRTNVGTLYCWLIYDIKDPSLEPWNSCSTKM